MLAFWFFVFCLLSFVVTTLTLADARVRSRPRLAVSPAGSTSLRLGHINKNSTQVLFLFHVPLVLQNWNQLTTELGGWYSFGRELEAAVNNKENQRG